MFFHPKTKKNYYYNILFELLKSSTKILQMNVTGL